MEECRREGEWFVVGESAALIMMSALQFICFCHDKSWWWCGVCFDAFVRMRGGLESVTSIWRRVLLGRGELFLVLRSTHQ